MLLQQTSYEDEDGRKVDAKSIHLVAAYIYIADGFFSWTCPSCHKDNSSRAWKVSGTVQKCAHCNNKSLMLRSDCDNVSSMAQRINLAQQMLEQFKAKMDLLLLDHQILSETVAALKAEKGAHDQEGMAETPKDSH